MGSTEVATYRSGRVTQALAHLPEIDPALASLALWCDMRDGEEAQTFTSRDTVWVGTGFDGLPLQEQIGLIGRHVLHIALRHERALHEMETRLGGSFKSEIHTLCSAAIVNECLLRAGHAMPRPAVALSDLLNDVLAQDGAPLQDPLSHLDADNLYVQLTASDPHTQQRLESFRQVKRFQPDIFPDVPDPLADRKAPDWHARLIRASQAGGGSGRGVGPVLRHIRLPRLSRVPWEKHLRGLMAKALSHTPRQSFRRPRANWIARDADRFARDLPRPVFEPAHLRQNLRPRIVIGLDTSGSVSAETLSRFAGEVSGISRKSNAEIHLLCFDDLVYHQIVLDAQQVRSVLGALQFRREGGTSFVDLMDRAEALAPSIIVVLTDGAGQYGKRPSTRVIWASPNAILTPPPFGEVLDLSR